MKTRQGFISNSSSTSFIITNKTNEDKTLLDFVLENPQLVQYYTDEYNTIDRYNQDKMIDDAENRVIDDEKWTPTTIKPGDNEMAFGDEDGDVLGAVFDYELRNGGESESFKWKFDHWLR